MAYGVLRITVPGRPSIEHVLDLPSVILGRAAENHVVVDSVTVSRRHVRLIVDSGRVLVEDLGSDNGTFVGGVQLAANTPFRLSPGQAFVLGDVEVLFIPEQVPGNGPADGQAPPLPQPVTLSVTGGSDPVAPGSQVTFTVGLVNRSAIVDEFDIRVERLPAEWVRLSRPSVTLMPGARDEITVVLAPPRSSAAPAGQHEFTVGAVSRTSGVEVRVVAQLALLPFHVLNTQLQPQRSPGEFQVRVANGGNAVMTVTLAASGDEGALSFTLPETGFALAIGESRVLPVVVAAKEPPAGTEAVTKDFTIEVAVAGTGVVERLSGQVVLEPIPVPVAVPGPVRPPEPADPGPPVAPVRPPRTGGVKGIRWLVQIYATGLVVLLALALFAGNQQGWLFGLGAWAGGLPLAMLGWRSTSSLKGAGGLLTRIGCLVSVLIAAVVLGVLLIAIESL